MIYGCVAQVVEHLTFNQVVRGSNPRTLTILRRDRVLKNLELCLFLYHRKFYQKSKKHIEYTKRNEYTKYIHMIN